MYRLESCDPLIEWDSVSHVISPSRLDPDTHINTHITFARIGEIRPIYEYPYGVTDCNEPLYPVWSQSVAGYD